MYAKPNRKWMVDVINSLRGRHRKFHTYWSGYMLLDKKV